MKKIHWIFSGLSLTIILLSINRLTDWTSGYLQPADFLRWVDFNAMLPLPLLSIVLYFFLKQEIVHDEKFRRTAKYTILSLLFLIGTYFYGAGSGMHEFANYLNGRFCAAGQTQTAICSIIAFNDDEFSHMIYFIGFLLLNAVLIVMEYNSPRKTAISKRDFLFVIINALFIAVGIFANLAFEEIGLDLYVVGSIMLLTHGILVWGGKPMSRLPVTFYFAIAFTLSFIGTIFYKINT